MEEVATHFLPTVKPARFIWYELLDRIQAHPEVEEDLRFYLGPQSLKALINDFLHATRHLLVLESVSDLQPQLSGYLLNVRVHFASQFLLHQPQLGPQFAHEILPQMNTFLFSLSQLLLIQRL